MASIVVVIVVPVLGERSACHVDGRQGVRYCELCLQLELWELLLQLQLIAPQSCGWNSPYRTCLSGTALPATLSVD